MWGFTTDVGSTVYRLFATDAQPATASENDPDGVELGVQFVPSTNGQVIGVRYYQGAGNTGTHIGNLWSSSGTKLATVTFPVEHVDGLADGAVQHPGDGHGGHHVRGVLLRAQRALRVDQQLLQHRGERKPSAERAGDDQPCLQVRRTASAFPTDVYQATNYWVEPMVIATDGGSTTPPPSPTPTPTPTPSPTPTGPAGVNIFTASETPTNANWNDNSAIELGVRFSSDVNGTIAGVRFYKGSSNGGVHTGSLWTASGQLLATATFVGEASSGWQTVYFSSPVAITAGTAYVASYHTNVGQYAATLNMFSSPLDRAPLHVPTGGARYMYGSSSTFPGNASDHNYWVDVVFVAASIAAPVLPGRPRPGRTASGVGCRSGRGIGGAR